MNNGNLRFVRALRELFESQNALRRRFFWIALLTGALFVILFVIGGNYGILNITKLRDERQDLQSQIRAMERERDSLKLTIEKLKTDRREIERVAREEYGMAKPGEKVVKFIRAEDTARHP